MAAVALAWPAASAAPHFSWAARKRERDVSDPAGSGRHPAVLAENVRKTEWGSGHYHSVILVSVGQRWIAFLLKTLMLVFVHKTIKSIEYLLPVALLFGYG
jgi:hypothetical protein